VTGILAARMRERLHRPVIAFADAAEGEVKGSARSIPGLHVRDVLDAVATRNPGLVQRFGGHAMAAGLSLRAADFALFAQAFDAEVRRVAVADDLEGVLQSDGELDADSLDIVLAEEIRGAGPWGQGFPEPLFDGEFILRSQRLVGARHLRMVVSPVGATTRTAIDAIAFNVDAARWPDLQVTRARLAYRLDVNDYRGVRSLQLVVVDIVPCGESGGEGA
jgi:single-stranded-DNA-specific exonuclease